MIEFQPTPPYDHDPYHKEQRTTCFIIIANIWHHVTSNSRKPKSCSGKSIHANEVTKFVGVGDSSYGSGSPGRLRNGPLLCLRGRKLFCSLEQHTAPSAFSSAISREQSTSLSSSMATRQSHSGIWKLEITSFSFCFIHFISKCKWNSHSSRH